MALITEVHLEQQALDQVVLFQAPDGQGIARCAPGG